MLSARDIDINVTVDIGSHEATTLIIIWFNRTHVSIISIIIIIVERTLQIYITFPIGQKILNLALEGGI